MASRTSCCNSSCCQSTSGRQRSPQREATEAAAAAATMAVAMVVVAMAATAATAMMAAGQWAVGQRAAGSRIDLKRCTRCWSLPALRTSDACRCHDHSPTRRRCSHADRRPNPSCPAHSKTHGWASRCGHECHPHMKREETAGPAATAAALEAMAEQRVAGSGIILNWNRSCRSQSAARTGDVCRCQCR